MSSGLDIAAAFQSIRRILTDEGVSHAFIGALAAVAWGRPRATTDVDLVVLADEDLFNAIDRWVRDAGFIRGSDVGPSDPSERLPDIAVYWSREEPSVRIDLFVAKTPFEREVIRTASTAFVLGEPTRLASPEASIIYKLLADRSRDRDDIESIFLARQAAGEALDWDWLRRWAREWEIEARLVPLEDRFRPK